MRRNTERPGAKTCIHPDFPTPDVAILLLSGELQWQEIVVLRGSLQPISCLPVEYNPSDIQGTALVTDYLVLEMHNCTEVL
jgi:hypothetical protein